MELITDFFDCFADWNKVKKIFFSIFLEIFTVNFLFKKKTKTQF